MFATVHVVVVDHFWRRGRVAASVVSVMVMTGASSSSKIANKGAVTVSQPDALAVVNGRVNGEVGDAISGVASVSIAITIAVPETVSAAVDLG